MRQASEVTKISPMSVAGHVEKYIDHKNLMISFFTNFSFLENGMKKLKYLDQIKNLAESKPKCITVYMDDIKTYFDDLSPNELSNQSSMIYSLIETNCIRYLRLMYDASEFLRKSYNTTVYKKSFLNEKIIYDEMVAERCTGKQELMEKAGLPAYLRASYEIRLIASTGTQPLSVRALRAVHIGRLVSVEGMVSKVSSVKPRIMIAYYKCLDCNADLHQPVLGAEFHPLLYCQSSICIENQRRGELRLIYSQCKFIKYQEIKFRESTHHVPRGSIPEMQNVVMEGGLTQQLSPGQAATLTGVLTPISRFETFSRFMSTALNTVFYVTSIELHKKIVESEVDHHLCESRLPYERKEKLKHLISNPHLYEILAKSIAPNIHGMEDVKKALLLQLVGATNKRFSDGMRLRGDIHVLLMGDPGVAKSQLLGQVCRISHRSNYTTGKGSSGVGLTAAVVRDVKTGDVTLEVGAIVLSDKGICCIDEFDKMDEYDRTAVHEVMEQQTVSISKAGLTTSLNARTAILGAANPQYGRYDIRKTPMQNINLPAALLSRFDIQFLLLDRADRAADEALARNILHVHQTSSYQRNIPCADAEMILCPELMRILVMKAKRYDPKLPRHLTREIIQYYVVMRQKERSLHTLYEYTTPRTLLAILRMSQSLARIRFSEQIDRGDFEEALRLLQESKRSVVLELERQSLMKDSKGRAQGNILEILKEVNANFSVHDSGNVWLPIHQISVSCARHGYDHEFLMKTISVYEELNIIEVDESRENFRFLD